MSRTREAITSSWKSPYATPITSGKRGRPRKVLPPASQGCVWPSGTAICGNPIAPGLAVCCHHARILEAPPDRKCGWPSCPQSGFKGLCS
ncbi:MAG: hypothetical protein ACRD1T_24390, partial [Acidimicrobiia bacterium]